jgi:hypothetical protein
MNWLSESPQVVGVAAVDAGGDRRDLEPVGCLPQLIRGMGQWNEAIARDRHGTGDPDRISTNEYFPYAASMMSRAAKTAIDGALTHAISWGVDGREAPGARPQWAVAHHVVKTVLQAWVTLWHDLAALQDQISGTAQQQVLDQWRALADQAAQTGSSVADAAWAQRGTQERR